MDLSINAKIETGKITSFIKTTLKEQGFGNLIIGLSGGIDSAVSLTLASKSLAPQNIFVAHLYYFQSQIDILQPLLKRLNIPQKNIYNLSIKRAVDQLKRINDLTKKSENYNIRIGNIMARIRMIILYDLAKKHNGLVCGTENKSELHLGYFTRFGDEASDLEPIQHLYKTQIYQLAKYLELPKAIIDAPPTAGLWKNQTDESDFGFSYKEADEVLSLYLTNAPSSRENFKKFPNAQKILAYIRKNSFKHSLPYTIK